MVSNLYFNTTYVFLASMVHAKKKLLLDAMRVAILVINDTLKPIYGALDAIKIILW